MADETAGNGGVKAKPYGRPAAGLDTAAKLNIATLNDVVISIDRVRQHSGSESTPGAKRCVPVGEQPIHL